MIHFFCGFFFVHYVSCYHVGHQRKKISEVKKRNREKKSGKKMKQNPDKCVLLRQPAPVYKYKLMQLIRFKIIISIYICVSECIRYRYKGIVIFRNFNAVCVRGTCALTKRLIVPIWIQMKIYATKFKINQINARYVSLEPWTTYFFKLYSFTQVECTCPHFSQSLW